MRQCRLLLGLGRRQDPLQFLLLRANRQRQTSWSRPTSEFKMPRSPTAAMSLPRSPQRGHRNNETHLVLASAALMPVPCAAEATLASMAAPAVSASLLIESPIPTHRSPRRRRHRVAKGRRSPSSSSPSPSRLPGASTAGKGANTHQCSTATEAQTLRANRAHYELEVHPDAPL